MKQIERRLQRLAAELPCPEGMAVVARPRRPMAWAYGMVAGLVLIAAVGVWQWHRDSTSPAVLTDTVIPGAPDWVDPEGKGTVKYNAAETPTTTGSASPDTGKPTGFIPDVFHSTGGDKKFFVVNRVTAVSTGAPALLDPKLHFEKVWNREIMEAHMGLDFWSAAEGLEGFTRVSGNSYTVTYRNDGTLVQDRCSARYEGVDGGYFQVVAAKVGVPYDSVYLFETEKTTPMGLDDGGVLQVLVGQTEQGRYVAEFTHKGVRCRVTAEQVSHAMLYRFISNIVGG